ncbi:MAG TPA: Gfo/Idh/MocA family oxidoreductase [Bryobacteraceae bacterium]|nr:Gfo/Idh/MocA family oxidoreductase [Bryobacteraceae bacterium]
MNTNISRRNFVRTTAAASAALAVGGRVLGANDRINVGMIGLGGRGSWLLQLVQHRAGEKNDVQVLALCDVYQKRLSQAVSKTPGAKTYAHHQELLARKDIDAVFIATPDHWHAAISLAALESGRDVYCEKPVTHTLEEAGAVAAKVQQTKRVMQVGVQGLSWTRWHKIRDVVQADTLGQVVAVQGTYSRNAPQGDWNWPIDTGAGPEAAGDEHIDWKQWLGNAPERPFDADRFFRFRKYWDYSGGIATDLHYHIVAPFHLAVQNAHPMRVSGMGGLWVYNDGRETPDTFLTAADYPGKWSLMVQSSQVNEIGPTMMIRGTHATLHLGDEWEGPQGRNLPTGRIIPETPFKDEFRKKWGKDEILLEGVGNEGDQLHVDNFFDCVRSRQQPNCPADLAWKVMTAIELSVRGYRENRTFRVDPESARILNA